VEADAFYAQPGMAENGLSLNQWPVGTGPFMMRTFERDRLHVLERNPNYRGGTYRAKGNPKTRRPDCWTIAASPRPSSSACT